MTPNGYLIFDDESFMDSTVAKMNALRKSGQFCDVRLQVGFYLLGYKDKLWIMYVYFDFIPLSRCVAMN